MSQIDRPSRTIRERLAEERLNVETMTDDELAFEWAHLVENLESVRIELRLEKGGDVVRADGWRMRAERAVHILKGRAALIKIEQDRRRRLDSEQRAEQWRVEKERNQIEKEQRRAAHEELMRQGIQRKQERLERLNKPQRFVRLARMMLPPETFMAIWNAVEKEDEQ